MRYAESIVTNTSDTTQEQFTRVNIFSLLLKNIYLFVKYYRLIGFVAFTAVNLSFLTAVVCNFYSNILNTVLNNMSTRVTAASIVIL